MFAFPSSLEITPRVFQAKMHSFLMIFLFASLALTIPHPNPLDATPTTNSQNKTIFSFPLGDSPQPSCYPVTSTPSDFNCWDALMQLTRTLEPETDYTISRLPNPFSKTWLRVPKTYVAGSCQVALDLRRGGPSVRINGAMITWYGRETLQACVRDPGHSGGGDIIIPFAKRKFVPTNWLILSAKPIRPGPPPVTGLIGNSTLGNKGPGIGDGRVIGLTE